MLRFALLSALAAALAGCNSTSQLALSTAGASGCIVGGVGTYSGSCTASVSRAMTAYRYRRK